MIKKLILFVAMLLSSIAFNAQTNPSLSEKITQLQTIDNASDKRFLLNQVMGELVDGLALGTKPSLDSTSTLRYISPADTSFSLYYLTTIFEAGEYQLDWVVSYQRAGQPHAFRFSEKIINDIYKTIVTPEIFATLDTYQVEDSLHHYCKLSFKDKASKEVLLTYDDVLLKSYFLELTTIAEDEAKLALNGVLDSLLRPLLQSPLLFDNPFAGFDKMGTIHSEDYKVKVISWNLILKNGDYRYFSYVLHRLDNAKVKVFQLKETVFSGEKTENQTFTANRWFGMEYYQIIEGTDVKNNKFYTLLGGRTNGEFTKSKIIDILWFVPNGDLRLGSPLFSIGKGNPRRLLYEYSSYSSMMVRYDADQKRIVLDHLSPKSPEFQGNARFYVPDFSYDALKFEQGKWTLVSDIDLRNSGKGHLSRKPKSNKL